MLATLMLNAPTQIVDNSLVGQLVESVAEHANQLELNQLVIKGQAKQAFELDLPQHLASDDNSGGRGGRR